MTTKVKKLKALLGVHGTPDADLLGRLNAVHDGMNDNSAFATPPVDMTTFKSGIDLFNVLVTDAADGGKKAIAAKNKQREVVIKQVTLLGHYVEAMCDDDLAVFQTSGFVPAPTMRSAPQPLPPASMEWSDRGSVVKCWSRLRGFRKRSATTCGTGSLRRPERRPRRAQPNW